MERPNLRDPDDWLYAVCSMTIAVIILAASFIGLIYLIVLAPSEAHVLNEGEDADGYGQTIICGIAFVASLALVISDLVRKMRGCPRGEVSERFMGTSMGHTSVLFGVMMVTTLVSIGLVYLFGEEVTQSFIDEMSDYENIASMMSAGPIEEFVFRFLLIGVPMVIICAFMKRASAKDVLGGFGMSRIAAVLLFISAVLFGLAHLDGWSIMKFPDTFISGLLLGYVYIEYGLHVTIVAHSAFDMLSSMEIIMGEIPATVLMALVIAAGAVLTVRSVFRFRDYIPEKKIHDRFEGSLLEMWER